MSAPPSGADLSSASAIPNGPGAAAILAAGIGSATLGILALAGDASPAFNKMLIFYGQTGALSGVTSIAVVVWLAAWFLLFRLWGKRAVNLRRVNLLAFSLLAIAFLLTFPPAMDFLKGKS